MTGGNGVKILDFLRCKAKKKPILSEEDKKNALFDEEYQLPKLSRRDFTMTEKMQRRKEDEELIKKYNIHLEKKGEFI